MYLPLLPGSCDLDHFAMKKTKPLAPLTVGCTAVRISSTLLVPVVALLISGCGGPRQVTYVDPNGSDPVGQTGDGGEPFIRYGAAVTERARACIAARAGLTVARTVAVTDPSAASKVVERVLVEDLPTIEPRGIAGSPGATRQLRVGIEQLREDPPSEISGYNVQVQRLSDGLLARTCDVAVPPSARQDSSFRAALLHETLQDAATSYEEAFDEDATKIQDLAAYQRAYGLLVDASTRQLEAVPEDSRAAIRSRLDKITRRATSGPTPPDSPSAAELVVGDLSALADDVVLAAHIDPTFPEPNVQTPDQLRSLKRALAAAVEAFERDASDDALQQLRAADRTWLVPASSGIAAVSPSLMTELERDVLVTLPDAIRARGDVAKLASDADGRIDEALTLVEDELEILRDSP